MFRFVWWFNFFCHLLSVCIFSEILCLVRIFKLNRENISWHKNVLESIHQWLTCETTWTLDDIVLENFNMNGSSIGVCKNENDKGLIDMFWVTQVATWDFMSRSYLILSVWVFYTIRIVSILSVLCLFFTLYSVQYVIVEFSIKMLNRKGDKMRTLGEGEHTRVSSSIIYNYLWTKADMLNNKAVTMFSVIKTWKPFIQTDFN
jgi:hypothetical protein